MNDQGKHGHQICKVPGLCNTLFITNICRLIVAGKNIFFKPSFSQPISQFQVFRTTSFSQRFSHNIFLTTPFSYRLSHIVSFIYIYIFVLTRWSSQRHDIRVIIIYVLCSDRRNFDQFYWPSWKPWCCMPAINMLSLSEASELRDRGFILRQRGQTAVKIHLFLLFS